MRFKHFLTKKQVFTNVDFLLECLEINYKDSSIKKISNNLYEFIINNEKYEFQGKTVYH